MEREFSRFGAPGGKAIRTGIHILIGALLVMMTVFAFSVHANHLNLNIGLLTGFAAVYYWGALTLDLGGTEKSIKTQLWLLALSLIWIVLVPIQEIAVYLVFPLFFLFLNVLPDIRGLIAVIGATLVAIFSQYPAFTPGGVLGPTLAALVSIGIDYSFRTLWAAHSEREALIRELLETRHQLAITEREAGMVAERQRIAHEIHDTLAQGLSSIQMLLHVAEQEVRATGLSEEETKGPIRKIELARHTASDNLSEARAMIAALQPATLNESTLEAALKRVAASARGVDVGVAIEGEVRPLPMKVEAGLLRLAQGAMANVSQHASASRAQITLTYSESEARLDVVDNGVGFDQSAVEARPAGLGHIGLSAMKSRAAELGGTMTVESSSGEGTAISVAIPVGVVDTSAKTER